jgi:hypothetical protein
MHTWARKIQKKTNQGEKERKYLNSKTYNGSIPSNFKGGT